MSTERTERVAGHFAKQSAATPLYPRRAPRSRRIAGHFKAAAFGDTMVGSTINSLAASPVAMNSILAGLAGMGLGVAQDRFRRSPATPNFLAYDRRDEELRHPVTAPLKKGLGYAIPMSLVAAIITALQQRPQNTVLDLGKYSADEQDSIGIGMLKAAADKLLADGALSFDDHAKLGFLVSAWVCENEPHLGDFIKGAMEEMDRQACGMEKRATPVAAAIMGLLALYSAYMGYKDITGAYKAYKAGDKTEMWKRMPWIGLDILGAAGGAGGAVRAAGAAGKAVSALRPAATVAQGAGSLAVLENIGAQAARATGGKLTRQGLINFISAQPSMAKMGPEHIASLAEEVAKASPRYARTGSALTTRLSPWVGGKYNLLTHVADQTLTRANRLGYRAMDALGTGTAETLSKGFYPYPRLVGRQPADYWQASQPRSAMRALQHADIWDQRFQLPLMGGMLAAPSVVGKAFPDPIYNLPSGQIPGALAQRYGWNPGANQSMVPGG